MASTDSAHIVSTIIPKDTAIQNTQKGDSPTLVPPPRVCSFLVAPP
ncbi:hypothetical protein HMPREF9004_1188 [Schaalia cardiffensis F0333]|uniref:Uncharacterized protein n=1 Tax=Schaalia cardiffensis F0333 TaxID=888050 RepID=N6XA96_9ACTO|nr:hypothetical protein HMPREF9004_1188 [Schaalia cardiffensis F0333]